MPENNYAFIDGQNLHLGVKIHLGWRSLDNQKFRQYLRSEFGVVKAFYFIGHDPSRQDLYTHLSNAGFDLVHKRALRMSDGKTKGNVDAELILESMKRFNEYDKAVIVSSDGDFQCLVKHLKDNNKLKKLIAIEKNCSTLLRLELDGTPFIEFLDGSRSRLEYTHVARGNTTT